MTGAEIRNLQRELGVRNATFAALCGVHLSTLHRWCNTVGEVHVEPFSRAMLFVLVSIPEQRDIGEQLERAYMSRGALFAIYIALKAHFAR